MSLIQVDTRSGANQFQIQIGEAPMYFEQRRLWEERLRLLVVCDPNIRLQQVCLTYDKDRPKHVSLYERLAQ